MRQLAQTVRPVSLPTRRAVPSARNAVPGVTARRKAWNASPASSGATEIIPTPRPRAARHARAASIKTRRDKLPAFLASLANTRMLQARRAARSVPPTTTLLKRAAKRHVFSVRAGAPPNQAARCVPIVRLASRESAQKRFVLREARTVSHAQPTPSMTTRRFAANALRLPSPATPTSGNA